MLNLHFDVMYHIRKTFVFENSRKIGLDFFLPSFNLIIMMNISLLFSFSKELVSYVIVNDFIFHLIIFSDMRETIRIS